MKHFNFTPPPPPHKLTTTALVLAALLLAGPTLAQTITAPGLVGAPACAGPGETDNPVSGSVSSVSTTSVTVLSTAYNNLYSALRAQAGDGGPTEFTIQYLLRNAKTNAQVRSASAGRITSSNPNLNASNLPLTGLTAKTPYVYTIETTASGFGESRPLLRRCFMTGGTYTPANESGQPGFVANTTSGCFSISPRTRHDVRNCLCGRSRVWNDDAQNTAARTNLGCAN
ncbi:MAG: hypothetical protein OXD47_04000 [Gammaproteobacteria bacterium]|nr:hypothetical protein [Gammaproteobacteria bacterium]